MPTYGRVDIEVYLKFWFDVLDKKMPNVYLMLVCPETITHFVSFLHAVYLLYDGVTNLWHSFGYEI